MTFKPGDTVFWWCTEWKGVREGRLIAVTDGIAAVARGGEAELLWAFVPASTLRDSVQAAGADNPARVWDANRAASELQGWLRLSPSRRAMTNAQLIGNMIQVQLRLESLPDGDEVTAIAATWAATVQEALTTWRARE